MKELDEHPELQTCQVIVPALGPCQRQASFILFFGEERVSSACRYHFQLRVTTVIMSESGVIPHFKEFPPQ